MFRRTKWVLVKVSDYQNSLIRKIEVNTGVINDVDLISLCS